METASVSVSITKVPEYAIHLCVAGFINFVCVRVIFYSWQTALDTRMNGQNIFIQFMD